MKDLQLLGLRVRDKVTGAAGVCESISFDLYGCIQAAVRAPADDKGIVPDGRWFDVSRLEVIDPVPVMNVPGGRFGIDRTQPMTEPTQAPGPADKPCR